MSGIFRVTRRDFLRYLGAGTGALVFGYSMAPDEASAKGLPDLDQLLDQIFHTGFPLGDFVRIELDGTIHIIAHRSEMGQGTRSTLAAVLADELEADWNRVVVEQADADAYKYGVPFPVALPGSPLIVKPEDAQFVDSSRSMAAYYKPMRFFGAGIRLVFVRAAAKKWGVDPAQCRAEQHKVYGPGGRSDPYNLLLLHARQVGVPTPEEITAALKPRKEWRYIGTDKMPFVDVHDMVTGKAVYGADKDPKLPMLTAMIERCPVANGKVRSFDPKPALAVPGVRYVTKVLPPDFQGGTGGVGAAFVPHDGVAVIAENTWAALQGRRALRPTIQWDLGPHATYDSEAFRGELEASTSQSGKTVRSKGDVGSAFASTGKVVEAGYYVPLLAQTPMEPPVAIAVYDKDKDQFEVWSPAQGPELAQHYLGLYLLEPNPLKWLVWQAERPNNVLKSCEQDNQEAFNRSLAKLLNVDEETLFKQAEDLKKSIRDRVKVHVTLLGGGFGRKSNPDYAIEAAFLAKQHPGTAIRVQWTREDDIQFSYYNAVSHQHLKAALDADGHPTALQQRSAFTSFFATLFPPPSPAFPPAMNDLLVSARAGFHNGGEYGYGSAIELGQGLEDMPYHIDHIHLENCPAESHIRNGWMRSVANIYHAFGLCSFADEMAIAAGRDSKDYLLELIGKGCVLHQKDLEAQGVKCLDNNQFPVDALLVPNSTQKLLPGYPPDTRRLRAVVERVAKESGWDEKVKRYKGLKGRGLGIAAHRSFLSYVAIVVDVSLNESNELTVNEIYGVIDCGFAVNLDRVRAQMEGGINYGLSYALLGEITVKNGAVQQNNFNDYQVLRIHQAPRKIYTYIQEPSAEVAKDYDGDVPPTGAGEPPTPAVAPALANAIVAAGGPRIREIPFRKTLQVV
ncbi:MAG TPA: molybdopterin cofactor-binding domain-containing protein [Thermoanaerobaculia bacterium]|jgi:isoquinoline 1-oxidoreductase beta subunit